MFSELDNALLPWLPYIAGISLGVWMSYEFRQAEGEEIEDLPEQYRAAGEQPLEASKPPSTKVAKKGGVAALIASEYQKRS